MNPLILPLMPRVACRYAARRTDLREGVVQLVERDGKHVVLAGLVGDYKWVRENGWTNIEGRSTRGAASTGRGQRGNSGSVQGALGRAVWPHSPSRCRTCFSPCPVPTKGAI